MSSKKGRIEELGFHHFLNESPEKELNELAKIASLLCDVPIAQITFVDDHYTYVIAGDVVKNVKREDSFCQHALDNPGELLIVNNSMEDQCFADNPYVIGYPYVRFYAGAPLKTENGDILGTLCVIDKKPKKLNANQKEALRILAKKVMDYLSYKKTILEQKDQIETNVTKLKKLTDNVPGAIFQLKTTPHGTMKYEFLSKGIKEIYPSTDSENSEDLPDIITTFIHPDDQQAFRDNLLKSIKNNTHLYHEYRVQLTDQVRWHMIKAQPEIQEDGNVAIYGIVQDITHHIEYESSMEQIAFDISHVLRRPVANLIGLNQFISNEESVEKEQLLEYVEDIKNVSQELDQFTRTLNTIYQAKKSKVTSHNRGV